MRTLELARHVRGTVESHFCALSGLPGALDGEFEAFGGRIHYVKLSPTFPARFPALLRRERFRAVHSHVHLFSGAILAMARAARVPIRIAHFRSTSDGRGAGVRRRVQRALMRRLLDSSATHILAVSEGAMASGWREDWRSDPRARVVYSGLDTSPYERPLDRLAKLAELGIPAGARLFIHVGRFDPVKNHEKLAGVFSEVVRRDPDAWLILAGAGDQEQERRVRRCFETVGVSSRVRYAGMRADVPELLRAAHAMIFPSHWEGLPGAVLEACAAQTPVLGSELPGVAEIGRFFPELVRTLSASAGDDIWALEALKLAEHGRSAPRGQSPLSGTPFSLESSAGTLVNVWTGRDR
jgi:glycosyltransferase involved in cell wall biosynthesis